jgi:hypothetical protein
MRIFTRILANSTNYTNFLERLGTPQYKTYFSRFFTLFIIKN